MEYTYLDAINYCISQIGAAPVSSSDDLLPDVQDAKLRLKEASMSLQTRGWWFNTDDNVLLPRDVNDNIPVPTGTIKVINNASFCYYSIRNNRLWDHENSTDVFQADVCVDVVTWLEWDDLPLSAKEYIRFQAAQEMIIHNLEDHKKAESLADEKMAAMLDIRKDDLEVKKRSMWHVPKFQRVRGGVRPYRSHARTNPNYPGG